MFIDNIIEDLTMIGLGALTGKITHMVGGIQLLKSAVDLLGKAEPDDNAPPVMKGMHGLVGTVDERKFENVLLHMETEVYNAKLMTAEFLEFCFPRKRPPGSQQLNWVRQNVDPDKAESSMDAIWWFAYTLQTSKWRTLMVQLDNDERAKKADMVTVHKTVTDPKPATRESTTTERGNRKVVRKVTAASDGVRVEEEKTITEEVFHPSTHNTKSALLWILCQITGYKKTEAIARGEEKIPYEAIWEEYKKLTPAKKTKAFARVQKIMGAGGMPVDVQPTAEFIEGSWNWSLQWIPGAMNQLAALDSKVQRRIQEIEERRRKRPLREKFWKFMGLG